MFDESTAVASIYGRKNTWNYFFSLTPCENKKEFLIPKSIITPHRLQLLSGIARTRHNSRLMYNTVVLFVNQSLIYLSLAISVAINTLKDIFRLMYLLISQLFWTLIQLNESAYKLDNDRFKNKRYGILIHYIFTDVMSR